MRRRAPLTRALLGAALALACAGRPVPAAPAARAAVLEANRGVRAALVARDPAALGALLDEDLVYTHANGVVQDRAALLASTASDELVYRGFEEGETEVRLHGDVAVVTGRVRLELSVGGRPLAPLLRYTALFTRGGADASWRLLAYQSTALPEPR